MSVVRRFLPFRTIFPDFLSFSIHSCKSCTTQTFAISYTSGQKKSRLEGGGWRLSENAGSVGSQSFSVLSERTEVPEQDLSAHKDEHSAAEQLRAGFVFKPEHMADPNADARQNKGRRADKADRRENADLKKGEGDADGERVDARCHGVVLSCAVIGCTTFLIAFGGAMSASRIPGIRPKTAEIAGGIILVGIGVKLLLEGLLK